MKTNWVTWEWDSQFWGSAQGLRGQVKETTQTTDPTQRSGHQEASSCSRHTIMQKHFPQIKKYECCRKSQQKLSGIEKERYTAGCSGETSKNLKGKTLSFTDYKGLYNWHSTLLCWKQVALAGLWQKDQTIQIPMQTVRDPQWEEKTFRVYNNSYSSIILIS